MFTLADILLGFAVPAVVAAGALLAAWRPWRNAAPADGRWAGAIAVGAAYAIAYGQLVGHVQFPPTDSDNWIVYFLLPAAVLGVAFCRLPLPPWVRVASVVAVSAGLVWLLLAPLAGGSLSRAAAAAWTAALAVAMTLWWLVVNQLARRGPRAMAPAVLLLVAAGAAVVLGVGGLAQRGGFTLGAIAVILMAVVVVAAVTPRFSLAGGGTLAVAVVVFGTVTFAYFYVYPDPTPRLAAAMALVLVSPALAGVAWLPGVRRRKAWQRGVAGVVPVLLAVAAAATLAVRSAEPPRTPEEQGDVP